MTPTVSASLGDMVGIENKLEKSFGVSPKTLVEFIDATSGTHRTAPYGFFGAGSLLKKDITTAGNTMIASDFFTNTFGAKVWDSLNSQTRTFNILRKVAWGNTTGWRIRSQRNNSTRGIGETEALPTIDKPKLESLFIHPSFVVSTIGVSALSQFLATVEGGLGDALAVAQEAAEVDHLKQLNQMVVSPSEIRVALGGASGTAQLVNDAVNYVSIGDTFYGSANPGENNYYTITDIADDGVIDYTKSLSSLANMVADEILVARDRAGFTSLADIVAQDGRTVNGVALNADLGPGYGSLSYGDRPSSNWNAAGVINDNDGDLRDLTTGLIDRAFMQVRINGFHPDILLTGVEQEMRLGTILQANQHFMDQGTFQVKQGGEATLPGYETGFEVATYKRVPLFTDPDISPVWQQAGDGDEKRGTDLYVLDTRFLEVPVLFTTQYMESRDYIHNNYLGIKALFLTAANLRCLNFRAQGKVTDLSDGVNRS